MSDKVVSSELAQAAPAAVNDPRPATASVAETAQAAAVLVLAGQYMLDHPEADPAEAAAAATRAVSLLGGPAVAGIPAG